MSGLLVQTLTSLPPLVYVVIGLATLLYLKTRTSSVPDNIPPFPVRPYPLLGHIPMMRGGPGKTIHKWTEMAGEIFSIYVGSQLFVVMSSLDVLKEALVKKADYFTDRPRILLPKQDKDTENLGIIVNSGPVWKEQRTVAMSILREFGMGKNWMSEKISEEVEVYLDTLSKFKGEPQEVRLLTNASVSNVICAILIGHRFELDDPDFTRLVFLLNEQISLVNGFSPVNSFPFLRHIPGDPFNSQRMKRNRIEITEHFSVKFIKERRAGEGEGNSDCFINAYYDEMRQRQKAGQQTSMNEENLIRIITNLFFAGTETTSTTLVWGMLYALHNPQCQEKINKEIQEHIGLDRIPTIQDRPKLNYTNAFIMETQRLGSIAPLAVPHTCTQTTTIAGYTIPKDTVVMVHLDEVLKDPKTWGDPLVFRPERFLDKDNKLVVPEAFVPFSIGRRYCMGESLARAELFLYMTGIFQRFHLQPEDKDNLPTLEAVYAVTRTPKPFKLKFIEKMDRS